MCGYWHQINSSGGHKLDRVACEKLSGPSRTPRLPDASRPVSSPQCPVQLHWLHGLAAQGCLKTCVSHHQERADSLHLSRPSPTPPNPRQDPVPSSQRRDQRHGENSGDQNRKKQTTIFQFLLASSFSFLELSSPRGKSLAQSLIARNGNIGLRLPALGFSPTA